MDTRATDWVGSRVAHPVAAAAAAAAVAAASAQESLESLVRLEIQNAAPGCALEHTQERRGVAEAGESHHTE